MPHKRQPTWDVQIEGKSLITKSVDSILVEDHDRLADKATVVLNDSLGAAADALQNGMDIAITMGWQGESAVLFKGQIQNPASEATAGARRLTLTAFDYSTLMHRKTVQKPYPPGTLKDVLTAIIGKPEYAKIKVGQIAPDPNPQWAENNPNLNPVGLTDLQFIQTLAIRNRALAFVEYCKYPDNGGSEDSYFFFIPESKIAAATGATLRCCGGFHEIIEFKVDRAMTQAAPYRPSAVIDSLSGDTASQDPSPDPPEPPASPSPDREKAADALGTGDAYRAGVQAAASADTKPNDMIQQLAAMGLPSDKDLATAMSQRDPTAIRGLRGRGVAVGNIHLRAKSKVTITGIAIYAEGDWYVRVARHKIENGSYTTELVVTQ